MGSAASLSRSDHDHAIRETGGPTNLTVGVIAANELLQRVGTTLVGIPTSSVGVTDHGALTGLGDDDHPQYHDGSLPYTGALAMGANRITGVADPTADQDAATRFYSDHPYLARGRRSYVESDFYDPGLFAEGVQAVAAGAGAVLGTSSGLDKTDHPGIWCMETGTTAAGRVFIIGHAGRGFHFGTGGTVRCGSIVEIGLLSTAAEEYVARAGVMSIVLPNTILFGIGFEYQFDQNGGRWQGITNDVGESSLDTGVAVTANTWFNLEFEVNAAGTSVEFFINGASVGTLATSANIPGGTGFDQFYNAHIMKLAGVLNRSFYLDHYYLDLGVTR